VSDTLRSIFGDLCAIVLSIAGVAMLTSFVVVSDAFLYRCFQRDGRGGASDPAYAGTAGDTWPSSPTGPAGRSRRTKAGFFDGPGVHDCGLAGVAWLHIEFQRSRLPGAARRTTPPLTGGIAALVAPRGPMYAPAVWLR
jgi:hypothetical protein